MSRLHQALLSACALSMVAAGIAACTEQASDAPSEEDIRIAHENVLTSVPQIQHPVNAELNDKLTYLGLDIDTDKIVPGKVFTLTHYWRVENPVTEDWKIFVHLEAPDNKKSHLNADHIPINGKYPVRMWKKGEIIRDIHRVSIPANWQGKELQLLVGAWQGKNRMAVTKGPHDDENRILVLKLPVEGAAPPETKTLIAKKIKNGLIKADGKLDEAVWKDAPSTGAFVRTMDGSPAPEVTTAKVLWDDKNLYVAFEIADKDVWSTLDKHDDKLYTQEAVEMFIDADGDKKTYVELQANPRGAVFDSYLPEYRKNQNDWDSNMKVGVHVDGTLDNRTDADKGWVAELAIPLEAAKGKLAEMKNVPPVVGTAWKVNFLRMDAPSGKPQAGYAWSPPLVGDFHALDRFGTLVFGNEKGLAPNMVAALSPAATEKSAPQATTTTTPSPGSKADHNAAVKSNAAAEHVMPAKATLRMKQGERTTESK